MSYKIVKIKDEALKRVFRLTGSKRMAEILAEISFGLTKKSSANQTTVKHIGISRSTYDDETGNIEPKLKTEQSKKIKLEKTDNVKEGNGFNGRNTGFKKRKRWTQDENKAPSKYSRMEDSTPFAWSGDTNSSSKISIKSSQRNHFNNYSQQNEQQTGYILLELRNRIMTLEDDDELQTVVDVIAETGLYKTTSESFDFDLGKLDQKTVKKLLIMLKTFCELF